MLQLIGLDTRRDHWAGCFRRCARFAASGSLPTLPTVLAVYVGVVVLQSALVRRQAVVNARLWEDLVHAWRDRSYRACGRGHVGLLLASARSSFLQISAEKIDYVSAAAYSLITLASALVFRWPTS